MQPNLFLTIYECDVCGEEYEMQNCYLEFVIIPCEECKERTRFSPQKLIHQSWEWDEEVAD